MKSLQKIIQALKPLETVNVSDVKISEAVCRPGECNSNSLFCLVDEYLDYGKWIQAKSLLERIKSRSPAALIVDDFIPDWPLPQLRVSEPRKGLAEAARFLCGYPDMSFPITGITGTNGKTTTTHLVSQLLCSCDLSCSTLGTLGLFSNNIKEADITYTTPMAHDLFRLLAELKDKNIDSLIMEVSSHALKLDRVHGLDFDIAVLTNLTSDHLDFHKTLDDYRASKKLLFTGLKNDGCSVINNDDPFGRELLSLDLTDSISYGLNSSSELTGSDIEYSINGTRFKVGFKGETFEIQTRLLGVFNIYNTLAAIGVGLASGLSLKQLAAAAPSLNSIPGRMEIIELGNDRTAVVDFAHTHDALEKAIQTLRPLARGRIITVFGCGGDRDSEKRPMMGEVSARLSDISMVTSDNPRSESPEAIIEDIIRPMPPENVFVEPDRSKAIRKACDLSRAGDIILVAGKGHESKQILAHGTIPFSDKDELRSLSVSTPKIPAGRNSKA
jgi:UDP-N-acetylmuramoyl-L-alanyl-D-glutamate--2,6-diaminopimelate ligase